MKTEDLVARLARDLHPERKYSWRTRALLWITAAVAYSGFLVIVLGVRADFSARIFEPGFGLPILGLGALAIASVLSFAFLSVPRVGASVLQRYFPWLVLGAWAGYLGTRLIWSAPPADSLFHPISWPCVGDLLIFALVPIALAAWLVKTGAPTQQRLAALHALAASGAIAAIGAQFVCADDSAAHLLVWHFLPLLPLILGLRGILAKAFHWTSHTKI